MDMSSDEWIKSILKKIETLDYVAPEDIPGIDLYMDQVTTFMDEHLKSTKRYDDDKLLTKTMINNYTKNNLLPPPNKKKYSKEHILLLIFIYYFKNILTINDIHSMFGPLTEKYYGGKEDLLLEEIYKSVFANQKEQIDSLMKDVLRKFNRSKETFAKVGNESDKDFLQMFSYVCMLSFDVYVKKQLIEKIIDDFMTSHKEADGKGKNSKESSKNKENRKEAQ